MKPTRMLPALAITAMLTSACQKKNTEVGDKVAALEKKANEALSRQAELERQIEEQKVNAERDALERERMTIEAERAALERQRENSTEEQAELLRSREQELVARESRVDQQQAKLQEKESSLDQRENDLDEKESALAGRAALRFEADAGDAAPVGDYGSFYDALSPYGNWFETDEYGYVWQPLIVSDPTWRPYTRGRWACTDRGWFWISDEPFGWACYHYGRWALCHGYGWVWIPGTEWAPSWVCWRSGDSHIGWAPLPPETLAFRRYRWDSSVEISCGIGALWFNFVSIQDFGNPIQYHCLPYTQNTIYISETVNCTNINYYNHRVICGGPFYGDIQRKTARKPPFYRIEEDRGIRPGRDPLAMRPKAVGNRLKVAAPNLDAAWNGNLMPEKVKGRISTLKVARTEEVKPEISERFRQSRQESQRRADQAVADLGGSETFFQKRNEALESNRVRIEENRGRVVGRTESGKEIQLGGVSKERARELLDKGIHMGRPPVSPPGQAKLRVPESKDTAASGSSQGPARQDAPLVTPPGSRVSQSPGTVGGNPRQEQTRNETQARQPEAPRETENKRRQDGPLVTPPRGMERPQQQDDGSNHRRQQEQQVERARQEQQEAQRQREQARQQQQEEARREQARQQQEENRRQQQMEENRREQARQQQEESRRQQQQEENRREQARQQQEESRRQQQQEESRREQARQEQQRQEQQRQEQQRQDDERRQRNR